MATKTPAKSPEGSLRFYEDQGFSFKESQQKMKDFARAKSLASTVKTYQDAQNAKVNPFNPMDEFQKFLDSKDETYWKNIDETSKAKVDPYYDKLKTDLWKKLGIDTAQLELKKEQNTTNYNQDVADIERMKTYATDDFARNIAKTDRAFATTIQRATDAYGQRGLLNSGVRAYGNVMSAKDQQTDKEALSAGFDKSIADLEASRAKAYSQYDLTKRSLDLSGQDTSLQNEKDKDKINRDRATELEVARANTDQRITDKQLGDITTYANQRGAIPTTGTTPARTASLSTVKTLQTKATGKRFAKPLLN